MDEPHGRTDRRVPARAQRPAATGPDPVPPAPIPIDETAPEIVPPGATSRWYEMMSNGKKAGWTHVVWSRSTWNGRETVLDVTTAHSRSTRMMGGAEDVFESTTEQRTQRGLEGELWHSLARSTERGGRVTTSEVTWTGSGYESVDRIVEAAAAAGSAAQASEERHHADAATPAHVDTEALVSAKAAAGTLRLGDRFVRRQLNLPAGRVEDRPVAVTAEEDVDVPSGRVRAWKVVETDPKTGGESTFWIDREGAVVRLKDLSTEVRRVASRADASRSRGDEASISITATASPPLQRIFTAERFEVDVHIAPNADRPRPEFPDSPWSRTLSVEGGDADGFTVRMALSAYDVKDALATIPVRDPAFAKDLEPTALMPCLHPDVKSAAERAVGGETDARKAAQRIADFVYTLRKESPEVAEASALEILRDRKGDCSEHALLFVALCRAAGIPARRCSGFVCIGELWGSHAWAEIWVGAWIGVDPTTNDVGTAARYIFYGYPDDPDSRTGTVSARAQGRISLTGISLDEGTDHVDLTDTESFRRFDAERRVAYDRLSGIDLRDIPAGWTVTFGDGVVSVDADDGKGVRIQVQADQGRRTPAQLRSGMGGGRPGTFAGRPAIVGRGGANRVVLVSSRKRTVFVQILAGTASPEAFLATVEKMIAPTFAEPAVAPPR